jgi:hypothetical protein
MQRIFRVATEERMNHGKEFIQIYCVAKKQMCQDSFRQEGRYNRRTKVDDDADTNVLCKQIFTRYKRGFFYI